VLLLPDSNCILDLLVCYDLFPAPEAVLFEVDQVGHTRHVGEDLFSSEMHVLMLLLGLTNLVLRVLVCLVYLLLLSMPNVPGTPSRKAAQGPVVCNNLSKPYSKGRTGLDFLFVMP